MKRLLAWILLLAATANLALAAQTPAPDPTYDLPVEQIDHYFDDAVIIGDSITRQLQNYTLRERARGRSLLGGVTFLAAYNYMIFYMTTKKTSSNDVNLRYAGKYYTFRDALAAIKPKKAFILLGLNDGARADPSKQLEYYAKGIDAAFEAAPGLTLIVQSLSPVTTYQTAPSLRQKNIDAFNAALQALCEEKGAIYLDIATPLKGEDGYLRMEYCSDLKVHLTPKGLEVWIDTLRRFARAQMKGTP